MPESNRLGIVEKGILIPAPPDCVDMPTLRIGSTRYQLAMPMHVYDFYRHWALRQPYGTPIAHALAANPMPRKPLCADGGLSAILSP